MRSLVILSLLVVAVLSKSASSCFPKSPVTYFLSPTEQSGWLNENVAGACGPTVYGGELHLETDGRFVFNYLFVIVSGSPVTCNYDSIIKIPISFTGVAECDGSNALYGRGFNFDGYRNFADNFFYAKIKNKTIKTVSFSEHVCKIDDWVDNKGKSCDKDLAVTSTVEFDAFKLGTDKREWKVYDDSYLEKPSNDDDD
eukprot:TRINITY_DN11739_c0_g1_i1.p1 TRINITY_DN11739_c0_g1~~TRINITY_DN11739_c0_g1_i1.p1  ORF type:complete len:198 (-),score=38.57 TRINITY_DN11739_c0_g1_i1:68-661(-)